MKIKTKTICNNDKPFLRRLSIYFGKKSLKFHWITDDDVKPHTHPWDFTSIIIFGGYNERTLIGVRPPPQDYMKELVYPFSVYFRTTVYGWLSKNKKEANQEHLVELRRLFGIKIPALTVGWYGEKKQLCSLCQEAGYCLQYKNK
jgi:hypothetical protein